MYMFLRNVANHSQDYTEAHNQHVRFQFLMAASINMSSLVLRINWPTFHKCLLREINHRPDDKSNKNLLNAGKHSSDCTALSPHQEHTC